MTPAPRFLLVAPLGAENTKTGGGQRTNLVHLALAQIGVVEVVLLGNHASIEPIEASQDLRRRFFPAADAVFIVRCKRFSLITSPLRAAIKKIARILMPYFFYQPDKLVAESLESLDINRYSAICIRYFHTAAISGLCRPHDIPVIVDMDDRDDIALGSEIDRRFRRLPLIPYIYWNIFQPRIHEVMRTLTQRAQHLWFAAREDMYFTESSKSTVLSNVSFEQVDSIEGVASTSSTMKILFVGTFGHKPNREGVSWFLDEVWRSIKESAPSASLDIIGMGNWKSLQSKHNYTVDVNFIGTVNDLKTYYLNADMVICPIFWGGGSKIKIIEAASFRRPIVSTSHSLRGFEYEFTRHIKVADTADGFTRACIDMLLDQSSRVECGVALSTAQKRLYSRSSFIESVKATVTEAIQDRS